ncbi:MAG: hypothetical protein O7F76_11190 [Planctomycetota bacterium]|nr:hypothetical protein [Planctomycetota bacterium]
MALPSLECEIFPIEKESRKEPLRLEPVLELLDTGGIATDEPVVQDETSELLELVRSVGGNVTLAESSKTLHYLTAKEVFTLGIPPPWYRPVSLAVVCAIWLAGAWILRRRSVTRVQ